MNINPYDDLGKYPVTYFVEDYCKEYPDDRGNQSIYAGPMNHKWVDVDEQRS